MRLTTPRRRQGWLRRLGSATFNYPDVGATGGRLPDGYRHLHRDVRVGRGRAAFERAGEGLLTWDLHRRTGLHVDTVGPRVVPGQDVLLTLGPAGYGVTVPCRVIAVTDESDRRGFVYGSLPGHVEAGEAGFEVRHEVDGDVRFRLVAFARPDTLALRLAGPVGDALLSLVGDGYVAACRRLALGVVPPRRG
ncbi:DUF1990 family protein [Egicoccus sp. AB-alg2]|uniref:DUF1990 family protein n=1 Tax=Egicoccus sp. AB-alg2 TaxID=3242693 RepID=UPI00359DC43F